MRSPLALLVLLTAASATAQNPVVLVNGYQFFCAGQSATFGALSSFLNTIGIESTFYDTCSCQSCSIEEHAARLRDRIDQSGRPVDVIASSMGGLILRSYLAGKFTSASTFAPPLAPTVRKAVFIATPQFGLVAPEIDARVSQMQPGSRFLWDLATWNQNQDDLRGVDAIAIIGSGGTNGTSDGLVPIPSASLPLPADPQRNRVIPYCHTDSIPFIVSCRDDAPPIGRITSADHPTLRIILSFLSGTNEWRSIGTTPSGAGGLYTTARTASNSTPNITSVRAAGGGTTVTLGTRGDAIYAVSALPAQTYEVSYQNTNISAAIDVPSGATLARVTKVPPRIDRTASSAAALPHLSLAPGMIVSLYGVDLAVNNTATVTLDDAPLNVIYASATQINAILPENKTGIATLTVQNSKGRDSMRVLLEQSVPSLYSSAFTGSGPAAARDAVTGGLISPDMPASPGQFVALYGTGLGATERRDGLEYATTQPTVTVSGQPARILFAGRAPGFPGLDQINIELPNTRGDAVPVTISSPTRTGNTVTLTIR